MYQMLSGKVAVFAACTGYAACNSKMVRGKAHCVIKVKRQEQPHFDTVAFPGLQYSVMTGRLMMNTQLQHSRPLQNALLAQPRLSMCLLSRGFIRCFVVQQH